MEVTAATSQLVKISVDLPPDSHVDAEGLWALPLGMSLYEVRNTPLLAYDLHWGDVVNCHEPTAKRPQILKVVHRSGHRTLRVLFSEAKKQSVWSQVLQELTLLGSSHCQGWQRFFAVDVPPNADYEAICYYLWDQEQRGVLQYETGMTKPYEVLMEA